MTGKLAVVFGGSGFIGREVVRKLAAQGWRVRVGVRRPHLANFLRPMGAVGQIQLAQVNVRYPDSIAQALQGADAIINLAGLLDQQGQQTFAAVQAQGSRNIARLAAKAGVVNVVHVSAIGADPHSQSAYARSKGEGEAAFREALPSTTILRPSLVFGAQDKFFNRFAGMARLSLVLPLIGGGKTLFQPIYVGDVADAACAALENPTHQGRLFELGGPEVLSFKELMNMMLRVIGRKRLLVPVPFAVAGMIGTMGDTISKLPLVQAPLSAEHVRLLRIDNVVDTSGMANIGTLKDFGITPKTLQTMLPTYLVRFRKYGQFSPETT